MKLHFFGQVEESEVQWEYCPKEEPLYKLYWVFVWRLFIFFFHSCFTRREKTTRKPLSSSVTPQTRLLLVDETMVTKTRFYRKFDSEKTFKPPGT